MLHLLASPSFWISPAPCTCCKFSLQLLFVSNCLLLTEHMAGKGSDAPAKVCSPMCGVDSEMAAAVSGSLGGDDPEIPAGFCGSLDGNDPAMLVGVGKPLGCDIPEMPAVACGSLRVMVTLVSVWVCCLFCAGDPEMLAGIFGILGGCDPSTLSGVWGRLSRECPELPTGGCGGPKMSA